jgi:hypothetical protein
VFVELLLALDEQLQAFQLMQSLPHLDEIVQSLVEKSGLALALDLHVAQLP